MSQWRGTKDLRRLTTYGHEYFTKPYELRETTMGIQ